MYTIFSLVNVKRRNRDKKPKKIVKIQGFFDEKVNMKKFYEASSGAIR